MHTDPLALADQLQARAEALREQARELRRQADEIRLTATAGGRHVPIPSQPAVQAVHQPTRPANYESIVRDIAYELTKANGQGIFTVEDVVAAGPSYHTALKWLKVWAERGLLEYVRDGHSYYFSRTVHESAPVNRPKREAPETGVVRQMRRSAPVAGVGGTEAGGNKLVQSLAREVRGQGVTVRKRKHKVEFVDQDTGEVLASASSTPGASSLKKTRGQLRQKGIAA